jgi:hypothetical protein
MPRNPDHARPENPAQAETKKRHTDAQRSAIVRQARTYLQTTTTATTLATSRVGRSRGDVLNAADAHARAGKGTESGLSTGTGGLGTVTYSQDISFYSFFSS